LLVTEPVQLIDGPLEAQFTACHNCCCCCCCWWWWWWWCC